jgi:hypothetical protein
MKKYTIVALLGLLVLGMAVGAQPVAADWSGGDQSGNGVVPVYRTDLAKNNECETLGYDFGFKVAGAPDGQFYLTDAYGELLGGAPADPGNSVTIYESDGKTFNWSSTLGIDAVVVKAGEGANVYEYDAESTDDTNLHSPYSGTDAGNPGVVRDVSHITLCYDYEVDVSKDAHTSFKRTYDWTVQKSADATSLTLSAGQLFPVNYEVTVDVAGFTDSDWAVSGSIYVENNTPFNATITDVQDSVDGTTASVDCSESFPYTLPAGQTLTCSYSALLTDGSDRTNNATVTTSGIVGGGEGRANVSFAGATIYESDECIDVSDTNVGALGTVCRSEAPKTFEYSLWFGNHPAADVYLECGDNTHTNTASFVTNDNGNTGSDSWTVNVTVACAAGCTLTQGYWKTHSEYGPAPYDDTWAMLTDGADTPFFDTGKSYYEILWMEPKGGNAYLILAHQYIAAELNTLNGASVPSDVLDAWEQAGELLVEYEAKLSIPKKGEDRVLAIQLYELLDDYNNGLIGPGHCSE